MASSHSSGRRDRAPNLTVIRGDLPPASENSPASAARRKPVGHELDWSILMARAQGGDQRAYRRLLTDIAPYLRALARRRGIEPGEIEDAVQDTLLALHAVRRAYDPTRPFGPWLAAIANARLVDHLRRRSRRTAREKPLSAEHETFPASQANLDAEIADRHDLRRAVTGLSESQQRAIRLLKLKEMSLKEAAAETGLSIAALKVATHRALRNLRRALSAGGEER